MAAPVRNRLFPLLNIDFNSVVSASFEIAQSLAQSDVNGEYGIAES